MGLRNFLNRRRDQPRTEEPDNHRPQHSRELRDAWLAFETNYLDRAFELATQYRDSSDAELAADAKKLVALVQFRRRQYETAIVLFRDVVTVHDNAGNWFNVAIAATLGGDTESGRDAFDRALAAIVRGDVSDGLSSPFMRQYYACALRDRGEFAKALEQIEKLREIYEQLKITDDTFVYIRGVPFLSHTMDLAVDVFRSIGDSFDWHHWIDAFARKLDDEGREHLNTVKQRLTNGTEQSDAPKTPVGREFES